MSVDYIDALETKEQFLDRVYRKGKSYEAKEQARSAINNLNYFCRSEYHKSEEEVLKELSGQPTPGKIVQILKGFVFWCGQPHPEVKLDRKRHMKKKSPATIRPYLTQIRKYMNEAMIYFDEALLINPNDSAVINNKGSALEKLKKYQEALEYFQKALANKPNNELYLENEEIVLKKIQKQESSQSQKSNGGGCLIATATFGSELAPQVQMLREIRDNSLLQTQSGQSFMQGFNQFYYSFSPAISDYERQNPVFKEVVKLTITPLITSLSLLNYVEIDSEAEVLGYGISLILLNVGMYFVFPAIVIHRVRKFV